MWGFICFFFCFVLIQELRLEILFCLSLCTYVLVLWAYSLWKSVE